MKKLLLALLISLCLTVQALSMTLAWDSYSDPEADVLRVYHSTDQATWTPLIDSIPTNMVAVELPDHTADNTRVYYLLRASGDAGEGPDSNVVSYFWTTDGGGRTGLGAVTGISLLDCSAYDAISDDGSLEWGLCDGRYQP